jgi:hypothetical protein
MEQFVIPAWIWVNAGILVAAAAYVAVRLSTDRNVGQRSRAGAASPTALQPLRARKA